MIREKVRANFIGKTEECMMDNGRMENNMEEECLLLKMEFKDLANGIEVEKQNGFPEFLYI